MNSPLKNQNIFSSKGQLTTFNGREAQVVSSFNEKWREVMTKMVAVLELTFNANVQNVTFDLLCDDLGNIWLVDASNFSYTAKPNLGEYHKSIRDKLH